ncbi:hypothetical protein FB565_000428 [Actinoplanes lutulentus]|uniref:PilZ domain-containing protein n=1 Tax=Actinoplanes lutulentus TaxID=1287878 RepID=A0A327ZL68_9ACTN|nr:hypothetical protein [Actinoplanes lutulentus]MBB2940724.1 hypothetical protein [Actinoplanes lutulentus]RAK43035.1 hypothetical protein B0I29_101165 [Actinoplanes lutulentus]
MTITVPAGSSLTLRCPGSEAIVLVTLAEVKAAFVEELPPIPVLSLDGPGVRRIGVLELVTSAGVTWVEGEMRDDLLRVIGDAPAGVVQRRTSVRQSGPFPADGTAQVVTAESRRLVSLAGRVEDISSDGLLMRADVPSLPYGIERLLLHLSMPWGEMTAAVTVVDQRADLLRGTFEWVEPGAADALAAFMASR